MQSTSGRQQFHVQNQMIKSSRRNKTEHLIYLLFVDYGGDAMWYIDFLVQTGNIIHAIDVVIRNAPNHIIGFNLTWKFNWYFYFVWRSSYHEFDFSCFFTFFSEQWRRFDKTGLYLQIYGITQYILKVNDDCLRYSTVAKWILLFSDIEIGFQGKHNFFDRPKTNYYSIIKIDWRRTARKSILCRNSCVLREIKLKKSFHFRWYFLLRQNSTLKIYAFLKTWLFFQS